MGIHISAELSEGDLARLLNELLPVTLDLDPLGVDSGRRWIRFNEPTLVDFVPKMGLRVQTSAQLQWTALGIKVPVSVTNVELFVEPLIRSDERGPKLVFRPEIKTADFKHLPGFADRALTSIINTALAAEGDLLGWHMGESLQQTVPLPANLTPVSAFAMSAGDVSVEVKERSFLLHLKVEMQFARQRKDAAEITDDAEVPSKATHDAADTDEAAPAVKPQS